MIILEQPTPTFSIPQPIHSEDVSTFVVAEQAPEQVPEYKNESAYERSEEEEETSSTAPSQFTSPMSDLPMSGPAPGRDICTVSDITPGGELILNLSDPILETDLSRLAIYLTVKVAEDSTEPVQPREERRSVLEGISDLIPPEYINVPYDSSRETPISFNNSTFYLNPWIFHDFLNFVEYHGYYVDRHVDVILEELKRNQRATPRDALILLQQLHRTSRIGTRSIVFMIEDFLYRNGLISEWAMLFFATGLDAGWYSLPKEGPNNMEGPHHRETHLASQPPPLPPRSGTPLAEASTTPPPLPPRNQKQTSSTLEPIHVKLPNTAILEISLVWYSNRNRYWYKDKNTTTPGSD